MVKLGLRVFIVGLHLVAYPSVLLEQNLIDTRLEVTIKEESLEEPDCTVAYLY